MMVQGGPFSGRPVFWEEESKLDQFLKALGYVIVGGLTFVCLYRKMNIKWDSETWDVKAMILACFPLWPVVWLVLFYYFAMSFKKES